MSTPNPLTTVLTELTAIDSASAAIQSTVGTYPPGTAGLSTVEGFLATINTASASLRALVNAATPTPTPIPVTPPPVVTPPEPPVAPVSPPSGTSGLSPLRIKGDDFTGYSGLTANLQKVITPNIGGAGGGTILYGDGANAALASIDTSVLYDGHPTMKYSQPGGEANTPELWSLFSPTVQHLWFRAKIRFSPGFTTTGTTSSANAYKLLGWGWNNYYGSGRVEISNTTQYQLYWTVLAKSNSATVGSGADGVAGNITTEWTDGGWYDYIVEVDYSTPAGIVRVWMAKDGQTPTLRTTSPGTMQNGLAMPTLNQVMLGLNFNQTRAASQTQALWYGQWEVIDASVVPNPYNL